MSLLSWLWGGKSDQQDKADGSEEEEEEEEEEEYLQGEERVHLLVTYSYLEEHPADHGHTHGHGLPTSTSSLLTAEDEAGYLTSLDSGGAAALSFQKSADIIEVHADKRADLLSASAQGLQASYCSCRVSLLLVASMSLALVSGFPMVFSILSDQLQDDLHLSSYFTSFLTSICFLGTFFTLPAGILHDRIGPSLTGLLGTVAAVGGYVGISFVSRELYILLIPLMLLISLGSGATYLCALATGVKANPARSWVGVSLVTSCVFISIGIALLAIYLYDSLNDGCGTIGHHDSTQICWREYYRTYGVLVGVTALPALLVMNIPACLVMEGTVHGSVRYKVVPDQYGSVQLLQATRVTRHWCFDFFAGFVAYGKHLHFWVVFFAYFAQIGSGIMILSQARFLWITITHKEHSVFVDWLYMSVAACIVVGTLAAGWLADLLRFRINRKNLIALVGVLFALQHVVFASVASTITFDDFEVVLWVILSLLGLGMGLALALFPALLGDLYGPKFFGMTYGFLQIGCLVSIFVVPLWYSAIQRIESPRLSLIIGSFTICGVMSASSLLMFLTKFPRRKRVHTHA